MPVIIDNMGSPMISTEDPNIWIGNFGTPININCGIGSCGAPLITIPTKEELQMMIRELQINTILL